MTRSARAQIVEAALAAGYTTDRGFAGPEGEKSREWSGSKGRDYLHVEFSVRGGITYAATRCRRFTGYRRLDQVLAFIEGQRNNQAV